MVPKKISDAVRNINNTLLAEPALSYPDRAGEKSLALLESRQTFEVAAAQTSGLVNLVFSHQTGFFESKHLFIDIPMFITELACVKDVI